MFESFIGVNFWTALFVLLNTVSLFLVMKKYLFQPVLRMIEQRQQEIDNMYSDAGKAKAAAEEMEAQYTQKLAIAGETGERMVKEAMARGQARQEEIIAQANREAAAILEKAGADIAREKKKAMNDAKNEISGIAMAVAEKVVGRSINAQDHADLVDRFIDELGELA